MFQMVQCILRFSIVLRRNRTAESWSDATLFTSPDSCMQTITETRSREYQVLLNNRITNATRNDHLLVEHSICIMLVACHCHLYQLQCANWRKSITPEFLFRETIAKDCFKSFRVKCHHTAITYKKTTVHFMLFHGFVAVHSDHNSVPTTQTTAD